MHTRVKHLSENWKILITNIIHTYLNDMFCCGPAMRTILKMFAFEKYINAHGQPSIQFKTLWSVDCESTQSVHADKFNQTTVRVCVCSIKRLIFSEKKVNHHHGNGSVSAVSHSVPQMDSHRWHLLGIGHFPSWLHHRLEELLSVDIQGVGVQFLFLHNVRVRAKHEGEGNRSLWCVLSSDHYATVRGDGPSRAEEIVWISRQSVQAEPACGGKSGDSGALHPNIA